MKRARSDMVAPITTVVPRPLPLPMYVHINRDARFGELFKDVLNMLFEYFNVHTLWHVFRWVNEHWRYVAVHSKHWIPYWKAIPETLTSNMPMAWLDLPIPIRIVQLSFRGVFEYGTTGVDRALMRKMYWDDDGYYLLPASQLRVMQVARYLLRPDIKALVAVYKTQRSEALWNTIYKHVYPEVPEVAYGPESIMDDMQYHMLPYIVNVHALISELGLPWFKDAQQATKRRKWERSWWTVHSEPSFILRS